MLIDFEPGDYVKNPANKDWGVGQVQSIIGNKVTVNFENYGKRVINAYLQMEDSHYSTRVDLWKYCYLYKYGGIFIDINNKCYTNFKNFIGDDIDMVVVLNKNNPKQILCSFIATVSKNPIILREILRIVKYVEDQKNKGLEIKNMPMDLGETFYTFMLVKGENILKEGIYNTKPLKISIISYDQNSQSIFQGNNTISRCYNRWSTEKLLYNI